MFIRERLNLRLEGVDGADETVVVANNPVVQAREVGETLLNATEIFLNGGGGNEARRATTSSQARPGRNGRTRANEEGVVGFGVGASDSRKGEERLI